MRPPFVVIISGAIYLYHKNYIAVEIMRPSKACSFGKARLMELVLIRCLIGCSAAKNPIGKFLWKQRRT
jgi:hypothetical protein